MVLLLELGDSRIFLTMIINYMRIPTHIMVHHSLTPDGDTVSWAAIEKYHREVNKWMDNGYHAGIEIVTNNIELYEYKYQALIGRSLEVPAAACPQGDMNIHALHVCCIGNYDLGPPPKEMLDILLKRVIIPWSIQFSIPSKNWVGHRDFNPNKTCPGTMFNMDVLRTLGTTGRYNAPEKANIS